MLFCLASCSECLPQLLMPQSRMQDLAEVSTWTGIFLVVYYACNELKTHMLLSVMTETEVTAYLIEYILLSHAEGCGSARHGVPVPG